MSSSYVETMYEELTSKCPEKKIKVFNAMTDDDDKVNTFKNVNEEWKTLNYLLYSPTITSVISFDEEHFDKMYCYVVPQLSCSQRCLFQMMNRVRKFKDPNITMLLQKNMNLRKNTNFYTYNRILKSYVKSELHINRNIFVF